MKKSKRKTLGQHFLKNPYVLRKIIFFINPNPREWILEIGAGKGILTFPLAKRAGKVIAIEKDKRFITLLKEKETSNLEIINEDFLKIDLKNIAPLEKKLKVVGNLPYSISSQILFKIHKNKDLISECYFLLQKEVAERICAFPHTKSYSFLSILFQIYFDPKIIFYVSPSSFSPPPKVDSAFIRLKKREKPLFQIECEEKFQMFLKSIFREKRKTLANNLKKMDYSNKKIKNVLQELKINPLTRAEELPIPQIVNLFTLLNKKP